MSTPDKEFSWDHARRGVISPGMPRRGAPPESSWRRRLNRARLRRQGDRQPRPCRRTATPANRDFRRGSSSRQPPRELGVLLQNPRGGLAKLLRQPVEMHPDTPGQVLLQGDSRLVGPKTKLADLVVAKGNRNDRHRRISLGPQPLEDARPQGSLRGQHLPARRAGGGTIRG